MHRLHEASFVVWLIATGIHVLAFVAGAEVGAGARGVFHSHDR
jgi:hypothetical protein